MLKLECPPVASALLHQGGFAKCYAFTAMNKQRTLAGKVIPKTTLVKPRAKAKLMTEIKIHRELCHDKIVKFESFFEDKVNVYILLELCTNHVCVARNMCLLLGSCHPCDAADPHMSLASNHGAI
jgi:serine/threonine protein kinase